MQIKEEISQPGQGNYTAPIDKIFVKELDLSSL
jgi:hypothetical protein